MSVTGVENPPGDRVESRNGADSRSGVTDVENARAAILNSRNDRRLFLQLLGPAKEEARQAVGRARESVARQQAAGEFSDPREGFWRVAAELDEQRPSEEKKALRLAREARKTASVCGSCGRGIQGGETVYRNAGLYVGMATLFGIGPRYENTVVCEDCSPDYMKREAKGEGEYFNRFKALPCGSCSYRVVVKKTRRRRAYRPLAPMPHGPARYEPVAFCSERCRWTFYNGRRNERTARGREKVCGACGEEFAASRSDAKFCCSACRQFAYRLRKDGGDESP